MPNCWDGTSYWQVSGPGCQIVGPISHLGDGNCATANLMESTPATCATESDTCSAQVAAGTTAMTRLSATCVSGWDIAGTTVQGKTIAECEQHCLNTPGCTGFEYGVDHGGADTTYPTGACQPQHGFLDTAGCNDGTGPVAAAYYNLDLFIINPHPDDAVCTGTCPGSPCIGGLWSFTDGGALLGEQYMVQDGCSISWPFEPAGAATGTISGNTLTLSDGTTGTVLMAQRHHGFAIEGMGMQMEYSNGYFLTRSTNADACFTDPSIDSCDCLTGVGTEPGAFEVSRNKPATMGPGFTGADGVVENGDEGDAAALVDGSREPLAWPQAPNGNSGAVVGECTAPLYVTVDLEQNFVIDTVTLWHYWGGVGTGDVRRYCGQKLAISETGHFAGEEIVIYDTGTDYGQIEGAAGNTFNGGQTLGRYVRHWSAGNNVNTGAHILEMKVMGREPSVYAQAQTAAPATLASDLEALAPGTQISAIDGNHKYTMTVAKAGCTGTCAAAQGRCIAGTYDYFSDWGHSGTYQLEQHDCFALVTEGESSASEPPLVAIDVDNNGNIVVSGSAGVAGTTPAGAPSIVAGPDGNLDAIQFAGNKFIQLGTQGVDTDGSWTIDLWISMPLSALEPWGTLTRGHLADHHIIVGGMGPPEGRGTELGGYQQNLATFVPSGFDMASLADGWHRLTVSSTCDGGCETIYYVDALEVGRNNFKSESDFFAVGNFQGGGQAWRTPIHRLRIYSEALMPDVYGDADSQLVTRATTYGLRITSPYALQSDDGVVTGTTTNNHGCAETITHTVATTVSGLCARPEGGTTVTYTGTPCGDGSQIQWTSMSSANVRDDTTESLCHWSTAGHDASWMDTYTGSCGVAPTAVPDLPTSCGGDPWIQWSNGFTYNFVSDDRWTLMQTPHPAGGAPMSLGIWDGSSHGTLEFTGGDVSGCLNAGGSGPRQASVNIISGGTMSLAASEPAICVRCTCRNRPVCCA